MRHLGLKLRAHITYRGTEKSKEPSDPIYNTDATWHFSDACHSLSEQRTLIILSKRVGAVGATRRRSGSLVRHLGSLPSSLPAMSVVNPATLPFPVPPAKLASLKMYTRSEVAAKNSENAMWITIDSFVYDVTTFAELVRSEFLWEVISDGIAGLPCREMEPLEASEPNWTDPGLERCAVSPIAACAFLSHDWLDWRPRVGIGSK